MMDPIGTENCIPEPLSAHMHAAVIEKFGNSPGRYSAPPRNNIYSGVIMDTKMATPNLRKKKMWYEAAPQAPLFLISNHDIDQD
jgi:hypothetical protein